MRITHADLDSVFPWPLWEVRIMGKRYGGFFTKRGARKWIANYPEDFQ